VVHGRTMPADAGDRAGGGEGVEVIDVEPVPRCAGARNIETAVGGVCRKVIGAAFAADFLHLKDFVLRVRERRKRGERGERGERQCGDSESAWHSVLLAAVEMGAAPR